MNETNNSELNQNSVSPSDTDNTLNPVIDNKINTESTNDGQDKISDIVSPLDSETSPKSKKIPLTIRCPFTTQDLNLYIDPDSNVLHLKRKICKEFPSNPKPSDQRLIYGGRIIENNEILSDVLKRQLSDLSTPPIIHLIINSLAIKHAQTVKRPASHSNSEHLSSNNTPSSSIQNSPSESKHNLNDTKSPSNLSLTSDNTNDTKEKSEEKSEEKKVETSVESKASTPIVINNPFASEDIPVELEPPNNDLQYVLINNIIYAVQVAPSFSIPMYIEQPPLINSNETNNTTRAENNTNSDNNNDNNGNNNDAAQPAADNAQQEVVIGNDDPQRQQPNQFFLIIRLAFIVYLLTQGGGYIRMIIVTLIAIIIFLVQTGRLTVTIIRNNGILNPNEQANNNNNNENNNREVNNNNQADNNNNENDPLLNNNNDNNVNNNNENNEPNNNNNNNPENVVQQYSFLTNCRRVFFAFFLSLIPFIQDVA